MIYKTPEEFKQAVDDYMDSPDVITVYTKDGPKEGQAMCADAIAVSLGFSGRQGIYDQRKRGPEWAEVVEHFRRRCRIYWRVQGQVGNSGFATWILSSFDDKADLSECNTDLERARKLIDMAADGDIDLEKFSKLMSGIKTASDINKVDELERLVRELADMAGVK